MVATVGTVSAGSAISNSASTAATAETPQMSMGGSSNYGEEGTREEETASLMFGTKPKHFLCGTA
jgi:hypothetical protein